MRRIFGFLLVLSVVLVGCSGETSADSGMLLRQKSLSSNGCTFDAVVVADYTDMVFEFGLRCRAESSGRVYFEVTSPESICGISGYIDEHSGNLTFDDKVLAFSTIADGYLTPVSVPWIMVKGINGGYLSSCTVSGTNKTLYIDDSYEAETVNLQITLDQQDLPVFCEVIWKGRRVLSMKVENFVFL